MIGFAMGSVTLHFGNQTDEMAPPVDREATVEIRRFKVSFEERERLLSVTQFSDEARITQQAVRKMIAEGRLRAQKIGEQHVISRDELNRYLAER